MNRFMSSAAAIAVLGVGATLAPAAPANAAASHFNTNPYTTGCASNSYAISSRAVAGGTAYIKASRNCGTNWLEYRGAQQTTTKAGKDSSTNQWTNTEVDNVTVAVSMQSYAPGTTAYTGWIKIGNTTTTANCTYGCTWGSSTPNSTENPYPVSGLRVADQGSVANQLLNHYYDKTGTQVAIDWSFFAKNPRLKNWAYSLSVDEVRVYDSSVANDGNDMHLALGSFSVWRNSTNCFVVRDKYDFDPWYPQYWDAVIGAAKEFQVYSSGCRFN